MSGLLTRNQLCPSPPPSPHTLSKSIGLKCRSMAVGAGVSRILRCGLSHYILRFNAFAMGHSFDHRTPALLHQFPTGAPDEGRVVAYISCPALDATDDTFVELNDSSE